MNPALNQLHSVGWVHRDFTPGNIIVVGTTTKISDFEFAKRREVHRLERLTKPTGASSHVAGRPHGGVAFCKFQKSN